MNSQEFLFINFIIFLALILYFVFGRPKRKASVQLKLKAVTKDTSLQSAVNFIYNGHEWEAYEVLGLPKGSNLQITTSHYQNLIKTSDPSTFEFYETAYLTILKTRSLSTSQ